MVVDVVDDDHWWRSPDLLEITFLSKVIGLRIPWLGKWESCVGKEEGRMSTVDRGVERDLCPFSS